MMNVCIPVLKRYDMLARLLSSLRGSTLKPDLVCIIDNGKNREAIKKAMESCPDCHVDIVNPSRPLGVAESWNWFLKNISEDRIISNDDIAFAPDSLALLAEAEADVAFGVGVGFSCFLIRDRCVKKIGYFDETISPGYAYYEDEDYMTRMRQHRVSMVDVDCHVVHDRSSTLAVNTPEEWSEHHRKFRIAQQNYVKKWGGMPGDIKPTYPRETVEVK